MRSLMASVVAIGVLVLATASSAQTPPAAAGGTDLYHVHFTKAAPGQAAALGKALVIPDKTSPMPEHFVVLRHQEGDDWDYAVIEHLGAKTELSAASGAGPDPASALRAWHNDTYVTGPSWGEFTRQMGLGGSGAATAVYILGVHRPVAGHREPLEKALNAIAPSKVPSGNVLLTHREGSEWTFATLTRYNSWSDLAADRAGAAADAPGTAGGWADIREHSAFHRDTIADRIYPAK
jgi:hypothetical protein